MLCFVSYILFKPWFKFYQKTIKSELNLEYWKDRNNYINALIKNNN